MSEIDKIKLHRWKVENESNEVYGKCNKLALKQNKNGSKIILIGKSMWSEYGSKQEQEQEHERA